MLLVGSATWRLNINLVVNIIVYSLYILYRLDVPLNIGYTPLASAATHSTIGLPGLLPVSEDEALRIVAVFLRHDACVQI